MKHRKLWIGILIAILILLLLLISGVWGIWFFYHSKLDLIQYDDGSREIDISTVYPVEQENIGIDLDTLPSRPELQPEEASRDPEESTAQSQPVEQMPVPDPIQPPQGEILTDPDVFNLLLLGTDDRTMELSENARADSIMVASINTAVHTVKLVSIERGIGVPVPGRNDDWITHTFRYGGAQLTMQTVRDCFLLDVNRYVRVNFHVFESIIYLIGGIDVEMNSAEARAIGLPEDQLYTGIHHLDHETALRFARLRHIDSDWQRIRRQRKVIKAAVNQIRSLNLFQLNELVNQVLPLIQTNLSKEEITDLLMQAPDFLTSGQAIEDLTIPVDGTYWGITGVDGRSLIAVDFMANARILRDLFYEK